MELKIKDIYRIECKDALSANELFSLSVLYGPLLSAQAMRLYCLLVSEANHSISNLRHERLCTLLNVSIMDLQKAREQLEQFSLLKTYYRESSHNGYYIYVMRTPLLPNDFLNNDIFGRLYLKYVGKQQLDITCQMISYTKNKNKLQDYVDISKPFKSELVASWDEKDEENFHDIRSKQPVEELQDLPGNFDYELLLKDASYMEVPAQFRDPQTLTVVGELAVLYGISPQRMRFLFSKSIRYDFLNPSMSVFDEQVLREKCQKENLSNQPVAPLTENTSIYDVSPVQFLSNQQDGVAVTYQDQRLLEYLMRELQLPAPVVNVMVEYILNRYNKSLTRAISEKIGSQWVRLKIDTIEKALEWVRQAENNVYHNKKTKKTKKPEIVPQWNVVNEEQDDEQEAKKLMEEYMQRAKMKGELFND